MDIKICKKIITTPHLFIPHLFTKRQVDIIKKHLSHKQLSPTEKTYFYSTISKKISALNSLQEEYYITGTKMIPERIEKAKKLLTELNVDQAFISGSFLFSKRYNDIDIYIIGNSRKQFHQENHNFIYLTKKDLKLPLFFSAANYSVSNFQIDIKPLLKRESFTEILTTYQLAINEILDNTDQKTVRQLLFYYGIMVKKEIINSYTLSQQWKNLINYPATEKIKRIQQLTKEIISASYSQRYTYQETILFENRLIEMQKEYSTPNLPIYLKLAQEVKHECRTTAI